MPVKNQAVMIAELLWTGVRVPPGDVHNQSIAPLKAAGRADRGPQQLMVREDAGKTLGPNLHVKKKPAADGTLG